MSDTIRVLGWQAGLAPVTALSPISIQDATPVPGDVIALDGSVPARNRKRLLIVCYADVVAHGVTFSVDEGTAVGMSDPTSAETSGSLAKLSADGFSIVSVKHNPAKEFIQVTATGDSADTNCIAGAIALFLPDGV